MRSVFAYILHANGNMKDVFKIMHMIYSTHPRHGWVAKEVAQRAAHSQQGEAHQ